MLGMGIVGPRQRREMIKDALLENPLLSHRAIANRVGVHHDTVDTAVSG